MQLPKNPDRIDLAVWLLSHCRPNTVTESGEVMPTDSIDPGGEAANAIIRLWAYRWGVNYRRACEFFTHAHAVRVNGALPDPDILAIAKGDDRADVEKALEELRDKFSAVAKAIPKGKNSRTPKRRSPEPKGLTARQLEAVQQFGEHKGNTSAAARAMGVSRKTANQHYKAGLKKLGKQPIKSKTVPLSRDRRNQETASEDRRSL